MSTENNLLYGRTYGPVLTILDYTEYRTKYIKIKLDILTIQNYPK